MFPMPELGDDLFHLPKTTAETMHSDSDLQDNIFAPATTIERTSKFHPKSRISNKKILPKPSKSSAPKGPSSTSKFHDAADNKWPEEGSSGLSSGSLCSSISSPAHHVVQDPEGNVVLDEVPQLGVRESKQRTDMSCCLESLDGYIKSLSASDAETRHYDSDLHDDTFAPTTTTVPSCTSKFPDAADSMFSVEGSIGPSSGFLGSSVASHAPHIVQDPPRNAECSISNDILDEALQSDRGESVLATEMTCRLESLVGDIQPFYTSATVGGCQANAKESVETVNPVHCGDDSVDILTQGFSSLIVRRSSELHAFDKLSSVPVEVAQNRANASQTCADMRNSEIENYETTALSNVEGLDESLFEVNARSEGIKGKFRPKSCPKIVKRIPISSSDGTKTLEPPCVPETKSRERLSFSTLIESTIKTCDFEVPDIQKSATCLDSTFNYGTSHVDEEKLGEIDASDQFAGMEMFDSNTKQIATTDAARPVFTSNLYSNSSDPISVSSELEVSQSPLVTEGFAAIVEGSYFSERDANLQTDSARVGKEPTTAHSSVEPLDDLFLQSDPIAVQEGKFRPKPALRMKQGKKTKSVSFILPNNDGESAASAECQSELVTSNPIRKITSFVEMMSDQNMDDSLGSLLACNREDQVDLVGLVREDVMDISALDTLDILSEPVCNSDEHVEKFQSELLARTKRARANADNSHGLTDFGSSKLDSLHIGSVATNSASISPVDTVSEYSQLDSLPIHNESLDAHGPCYPAGDLIESLSIKAHNCFPANSSEERACLENINDLEAQSLTENEDLHTMVGEHTVDCQHIEEPNLEECGPSIVQKDEAGKSSRKVQRRNKKLKYSVVDNMVSTHQNATNTISEIDDDYGGDGYKDDDMPKKKRRKLPRKSSSRSSEHEGSIESSEKASEEPGSTVKNPPKKRLPHGSSRCKSAKRQVNKALLEIPDDELDRRQLVIRDLIRLAGFKERISNKEAAALKNSFANQSEEHEQDTNGDDANGDNQQEGPRLNYHSYMRRPLQTRWSKTDTELFYQAIRQFGTDFAMIQVLFPNRSRQQVKAKFKNEQRKHPLQIADAFVCRTKDHSHFEKVIQHLQAVAEQNSKNDASDLTTKSQDEADQNEEERIEANSKEEQNVNCFEGGVECSLKSNDWDGDVHIPTNLSVSENYFNQHSDPDMEKFLDVDL